MRWQNTIKRIQKKLIFVQLYLPQFFFLFSQTRRHFKAWNFFYKAKLKILILLEGPFKYLLMWQVTIKLTQYRQLQITKVSYIQTAWPILLKFCICNFEVMILQMKRKTKFWNIGPWEVFVGWRKQKVRLMVFICWFCDLFVNIINYHRF